MQNPASVFFNSVEKVMEAAAAEATAVALAAKHKADAQAAFSLYGASPEEVRPFARVASAAGTSVPCPLPSAVHLSFT